jgi:hypothetical protein
MSKNDSNKTISLPNTFQPVNTRTYQPNQLLTETYQPVGQAQVPTVIPTLVSGVAPAAVPPPVVVPPPAANASTD